MFHLNILCKSNRWPTEDSFLLWNLNFPRADYVWLLMEKHAYAHMADTNIRKPKGGSYILTYLASSNVCPKRSFCKIFGGDEKTPWKCDNTELQTWRNVSNCIFSLPFYSSLPPVQKVICFAVTIKCRHANQVPYFSWSW